MRRWLATGCDAIRMYLARKAYSVWLRLDRDAALMPTYPLQSFREARNLWGRCEISHDENQLAVDGHWYRYLTEQTTIQSPFVDACRAFHKSKAAGANKGIASAELLLK